MSSERKGTRLMSPRSPVIRTRRIEVQWGLVKVAYVTGDRRDRTD